MFLKWNIKYFVRYSLVKQIYVESMTSKLQLIMPAKKKTNHLFSRNAHAGFSHYFSLF